MNKVKITQRQAQIVELIRKGMGRTKIAFELDIWPLTVYNHTKALIVKGVLEQGNIHGKRHQVKLKKSQLEVVPRKGDEATLNRKGSWRRSLRLAQEVTAHFARIA